MEKQQNLIGIVRGGNMLGKLLPLGHLLLLRQVIIGWRLLFKVMKLLIFICNMMQELKIKVLIKMM